MSTSLQSTAMTRNERSAVLALSGSVMLRMLGLFMLLPVLAVYAADLPDSTPWLVGLAVGGYGLTQAALQIPLGALSDRIGRKPVIIGGLLLFISGSLLAWSADSVMVLIMGRLLQGAGAIAAASSALMADLTRESQRTKAMALLGISIGMSFMLALIIGPVLADGMGVPRVFLVSAMMGSIAILLIAFVVPSVQTRPATSLTGLGVVLKRADFLRMDLAVFVLHALLTCLFVVLPQRILALESEGAPEWLVYLSALLVSFAFLVPLLWKIDRQKHLKSLFVMAAILLAVGLLVLSIGNNLAVLWLGLVVFFAGFNFLEATMPSLLSKKVAAEYRGVTMGAFTTSQFLGTFVGGVAGGWVYGSYGSTSVFVAAASVAAAWLLVVVLTPPRDFEAN